MVLRNIVYSIKERLKLSSDDVSLTDEYIVHCIGVKRAFLLKQKYQDIRKYLPDNLKQTICLDLIPVDKIGELKCSGKILRSNVQIPKLINFNGLLGLTRISGLDITSIPFNFINQERLPFVGQSRWLKNQIYVVIGDDNYLYLKGGTSKHLLLRHIKLTGVFENPENTLLLDCTNTNDCADYLDMEYPIEDSLLHLLENMIVQELGNTLFVIPEDTKNDAKQTMAQPTEES